MRKRYYWNKETKTFEEFKPLPLVPRIHIQDDTCDAQQHPITGKVYESKSAFRRDTEAAGCHEVGNDYANRLDYMPEPKFSDPTPILRELLNK